MPHRPHPVLLYDDGCRFCRAAAALILRWDRVGGLDILPWSHPQAVVWLRPLDPALRDRSMHLRDADGRLHSLDEAVLHALDALPGCAGLARAARRYSPLRALLWRAYGLVARHRRHLSRISPDCAPVIRLSAPVAPAPGRPPRVDDRPPPAPSTSSAARVDVLSQGLPRFPPPS